MSPELLISAERPTKQSDCYALGMVIYEVLSGEVPFAQFNPYVAMRMVVDGERPQRPGGAEGARFTNDLWRMLNRCWAARPQSRPSSSVVLECLERVSMDANPPPERANEHFGVGWSGWYLTKRFSIVFSWFDPRRFVALLRRILC